MRVAVGAHHRLLASQTRRCHRPRRNYFLRPTSPPRISIGLWSLGSSKTLTGPLCCRAMASCTPVVRVRDRIDITDAERRIFDHLIGTLSHCNLQTQLRVAGGWVRDKLLGKECYDIDIAIDNMVGREFCEKLAEYLSFIGEKTKGAGVVPCNPEQSKHLETATMQVCDIWIDFVNLRSEDYSENSRIPTMRFGSPKEDAYRRDLTINSLFYNINTGSVEDFTGRGIADLKAGKIVTPLPPKDTFLDDPLRVLRAIRFGARFEFVLAEELMIAAACDDVRSALAQKISRERIGHEVDLMISGNQPVQAMKYIFDLNLFWTVFSLPSCFEPSTSEECHRSCVAYLDAAWSLIQLIGLPIFSDEQRKLCLYAAMFLPLRATVYKDKKSKQIAVVNYIFLNSLKLKSSYATTVMNIHNALDNFKSLIPSVILNNDVGVPQHNRVEFSDVPSESALRVAAGMVVREMHGFWRVALLVSMLLYPSDIDASWCVSDRHSQLDRRREIFTHVVSVIVKLGLEKAWEEKPLVNGREIMSILQLKTGGPLVKEWQHRLLEWQLAHPSGTPEECRNWMMETCSNSKRAKFE